MFIAIPVRMNYRTERLPLVTLSLIGINTLVWLVSTICFFRTDGESELWILKHLWLIPSACTWNACLTSMFVHAGIFHLLGNMIFLFLFGSCVEDIIGRLRFAVFYLVGGLLAEFVYIAMLPDHFMSVHPMGGASGAISACMGMYLLLRAEAEIEFKYFLWFFFVYVRAGEFEIPAWVAITFWFLKDLFWAVLGMVLHERGGGVAFGAHVGGLLGGLALASLYKWIGQPHKGSSAKSTLILDPVAILEPAAPQYQPVETTGETPTIYLNERGVQSGPFTLTQIQAALSSGAIGADAVYWSGGMADWQSVLDLAVGPAQ
jgi:membrane associated rhomboid family serine protease